MIKKVRAAIYKEIFVDTDCVWSDVLGQWVVVDPNHLVDLLRDSNDNEMDFDYDVIR